MKTLPESRDDRASEPQPRGRQMKLALECIALLATICATLYGLWSTHQSSQPTEPIATNTPAETMTASHSASNRQTAAAEPAFEVLPVRGNAVMSRQSAGSDQSAPAVPPLRSRTELRPLAELRPLTELLAEQAPPVDVSPIKNRRVTKLAHEELLTRLDAQLAGYPRLLLVATGRVTGYDAGGVQVEVTVRLDRERFVTFGSNLATILAADNQFSAIQTLPSVPAKTSALVTLGEDRTPKLAISGGSDLIAAVTKRRPTSTDGVAIEAFGICTQPMSVGQTAEMTFYRVGPQVAAKLRAAFDRAVPAFAAITLRAADGQTLGTTTLELATPERASSWNSRRFVQPMTALGDPWSLSHGVLDPGKSSAELHRETAANPRLFGLLPGFVSAVDRMDKRAPVKLTPEVRYTVTVPMSPADADRIDAITGEIRL